MIKSILILLLFSCTISGMNFQCPTEDLFITKDQKPKARFTQLVSNESLVWLRLGCPGGCSGFIVGKNLVMTSAHCTKGSPLSFVNFSDGKMALGISIAIGEYSGDVENDWALLQVDTQNRKPLLLACFSPKVNETGSDLTCGGRDWPKQQSYTIKFNGTEKGQNDIILKGPIDHGDSGSPVLNSSGNVVGIVSQLTTLDSQEGFATPLSSLRKALSNFDIPDCK
jgi:hypothetical protein